MELKPQNPFFLNLIMKHLLLFLIACASSLVAAQRPNVLFIISDDLTPRRWVVMGTGFVRHRTSTVWLHAG